MEYLLKIENVNSMVNNTCMSPAAGSNFPSVVEASTFLICASIKAAGTSSCNETMYN